MKLNFLLIHELFFLMYRARFSPAGGALAMWSLRPFYKKNWGKEIIYIHAYIDIYIYIYTNTFIYIHKYIYMHIDICTHTHIYSTHTHTCHVCVCVCVFWQHFFINTNFVEHNRHFLSTYFLVDPFILPYWFYRIRRELHSSSAKTKVTSFLLYTLPWWWPKVGQKVLGIYTIIENTSIPAEYDKINTAIWKDQQENM